MARRWSLALGLSLLAHVGLAVALLFGAGLRPWQGPIDVEITGASSGQVTELPLGGPPPGGEKKAPAPRKAHHRAPRVPAAEAEAGQLEDKEQPGQARTPEEEPGGPAPTDDLTAYGPKGSRVTVLLRLDRLRSSDLAPGIDALLARLPDHRDLLEGTGLDLFKSFDALLIATPHPLDPTVTFLAVRHHLDNGALRQALTDGAHATDRTISWRNDHGHWIAERRARRTGREPPPITRDDRLIVLPAPGLAIVTPPAYRALLLSPAAKPPRADAGNDPDAGAPPAGGPDWTSLLSKIDAEEGLMPPDGDAMMSLVDIFKASGGAPLVYGMELPAAARAVAGMVGDEPFLDLTAQFADEAQARHWETEWPNLSTRLRTNPFVILGGFSSLVGRLTLERNDKTIRVHVTATHDETVRLLGVALRLLGG